MSEIKQEASLSEPFPGMPEGSPLVACKVPEGFRATVLEDAEGGGSVLVFTAPKDIARTSGHMLSEMGRAFLHIADTEDRSKIVVAKEIPS